MKRQGQRILSLLLLFYVLALGLFKADVRSQAASNILQEIDLGLSGQTPKEWYEAQTSHTGDTAYFGAYVTLPVADTLYIGLGSARPAENCGDGSYFAKFEGTTLTGIDEPDEQSLHEMIYDGSLVHIAGTDPNNGDDHTAGNHYTYSPGGSLTKYRDSDYGLKNVYHTWGLWKSGSTLYAAVSAHDGTDPEDCESGTTCMGQVFWSTDNGTTWTHESDLGGYRAYDVIGFDGDLYAIHNDELHGQLSLSKSTNGGTTWSPVAGLANNVRRVHMVEFNSQLLVVSWDRASLYAIDTADTITTHALPSDYKVGTSYGDIPAYTDYNVLAIANGYLYLIAKDQTSTETAIIRTSDLSNWEQIVHTSNRLISLSYWPNRDWLVAASPGTDARLWRVDLSETPTAICLQCLEAQAPGSATWAAVALVAGLFGLVAVLRRRQKSQSED